MKTVKQVNDYLDSVYEFPKESVNHPEHYKSGKYECIEVMRDIFGDEAVENFCRLNAFKYLWRAENKNGKEDIKKAIWYLNELIKEE